MVNFDSATSFVLHDLLILFCASYGSSTLNKSSYSESEVGMFTYISKPTANISLLHKLETSSTKYESFFHLHQI